MPIFFYKNRNLIQQFFCFQLATFGPIGEAVLTLIECKQSNLEKADIWIIFLSLIHRIKYGSKTSNPMHFRRDIYNCLSKL